MCQGRRGHPAAWQGNQPRLDRPRLLWCGSRDRPKRRGRPRVHGRRSMRRGKIDRTCMGTGAEAMQLTMIVVSHWCLQNFQARPTSSACIMVRQQYRRVCNIIKLVSSNRG